MTMPRNFRLPHNDWRPYQYDTTLWCLAQDGFALLEAPTGSGKSAYAAAVSSRKPTAVLVRTKQLQEQYQREYGARVLYGRANYPCALHEGLTADDCLHPSQCIAVSSCEYQRAKAAARASAFIALNYAYALSSRWLADDHRPTVFLDEAHNLPDVTLEWVGCTIRDRDRVEFDLPELPTITHLTRNVLLRLPDPADVAEQYLATCAGKLKQYNPTPAMTEAEREHHRRGQRLYRKVATTLDGLRQAPDAWFVRSGMVLNGVAGFVARPLTACLHFPRLFLNFHVVVAMSATIGKPEALAEELGVTEYAYRAVPHRFPPEARRVVALDVPGMGRSATEGDFEHQADAIAAVLKRHPCWSGLVLVTRKREATLLAKRLGARGLAGRVYVTPGADGTYAPTDEQTRAWDAYRRRVPNAVCVTWAFWEGYNGLDERICIVAKTPFPFIGDDYERARMEHSRKMFLQRTAWLLEQGLGRTRRGRDEDYGDANGFVAIADGDWVRVKGYLSQATQESVAKL